MELRVVTLLTVFTVLPMILSAQSTECSAQGGTAILQVNIGIPLDLNDLAVDWRHGEKFVHLFRNGVPYLKNQDQEYKGRTSLFEDEISRGNVSLKLMNVTEEDAGTYSLTLRGSNIPDDQRKHNVSPCVEKTEDDRQIEEPETPVWVMGLIAGVVVVVIAGFALLLFLLYKCRQRTSCWKQNKQEKGQDKDEGEDRDEGKNPTSSDDQHKLGDPAPGKEPVGNEINGENPEERSRLLKEQPKKS